MGTLGQLSERILRMYYGGDIPVENGIQLQDVNYMIVSAVNAQVKANLYENMKEVGRSINSLFIGIYEDVPVLYNEARDVYYAELPGSPVDLNHNMGVYQISPMKDEENAFIPLPSGWLAISKGNKKGWLEGNTGFEMEGTNIVLKVNYDKAVDKLLVKQIVSIDDLDEDDIIPMPGSYEAPVIEYCLGILKKNYKQPDNKNDNSVQ